MKELSIEEKAKAYDEAIERAKNFIENGDERERAIAKNIFAGIIEESYDERIRKALIQIFNVENFENYDIKNEEVIAWLEKQGEHANFRNKIQIGDKVTRNKDGVLVNLSQLNRLAKKDEKQGEQNLLDNVAKQVTKDKKTATSFLKSTGIMDENGELAEPYRVCESTSNWSEEDEKMLNGIIDASTHHCYLNITDINWLKSLKEKVHPQNTWKPSKEQMYILNWVANILFNHNSVVEKEASKKLQSLYNDLKKLMEK